MFNWKKVPIPLGCGTALLDDWRRILHRTFQLLKMRPSCSLKMSGTIHPVMQHQNPEKRGLQLYCYQSLKLRLSLEEHGRKVLLVA